MARKGLPSSIVKKYGVTKKAWSVFKGKRKRRGTTKKNPAKRKRRSGSRVARRRRRRSNSPKGIPLAPVIGVIASAAVPIQRAMSGDFQGALHEARNIYTGFDDNGQFHVEWVLKGWGPVIGGMLVHKIVGGWLGVNRILGRYKVPFIRV